MKIEGKEKRKKVKGTVKDNPSEVLKEVYKSLYPNKRINLIESEKKSEGWLLDRIWSWNYVVFGEVFSEISSFVNGYFFQ